MLGSLVVVEVAIPQKPDQLQGPTLKEPACQTVRADQESEIHKSPKGGLYRIDAKGRKVYLKASNSQDKASHVERNVVVPKWQKIRCRDRATKAKK